MKQMLSTMDQQISWKKAYVISFLIHLVLAAFLAVFLAVVVAEKEQQVYEIDLAASDLSQGSGHAGGGSSAAFPEPLKAEEVAKRIETVTQMPIALPEPAPVAIPDAVDVPSSPSSAASVPSSSTITSVGADANTGKGEGIGEGTGEGSGTGDGKGDGQGVGEGSGNGQGSGDGNVPGTGSGSFDIAGFRAAVDANKSYPAMAIKRHLEGEVSVVASLDASGDIVDVGIASSSGHNALDQAAMSAVRNVGSYPNPTGASLNITVPVSFYLSD